MRPRGFAKGDRKNVPKSRNFFLESCIARLLNCQQVLLEKDDAN
jgi:hypothetical protein